MYTEGASGVFVAVVVAVVGAIVLSAAGLLVLREQTPLELVTPAATESVASPTEGAEGAEGTAVPTSTTATTTPATQAATTTPSATPIASTATPTATPDPEIEYVVVAGDGVELLAARFGVSGDAIIDRNNLQPPYTLSIGQVLIIPTDE